MLYFRRHYLQCFLIHLLSSPLLLFFWGRAGAEVRLGTAVEAATYKDGLWHLSTTSSGDESSTKEEVRAAAVVNCGGLWADSVDTLTHSRESTAGAAGTQTTSAALEVAPRRGDYLIYGASSEEGSSSKNTVGVVPVGGVPLPSGGRGPYLWRTVHGDLVCGPTNEPVHRPSPAPDADDGDSGSTALPPASAQQQAVLKSHGERVYGQLATTRVRDAYVGLRPALREVALSSITSRTATAPAAGAAGDYVVRFDAPAAAAGGEHGATRPSSQDEGGSISPAKQAPPLPPRRLAWLTCAGARSTGLTASLALGAFVAQLLMAPNTAAAANSSTSSDQAPADNASTATATAKSVLGAAIAAAASSHPPIAWPSCAGSGGKEHRKWALPSPLSSVKWPQLPSLETLAQSFAERNDGCVEIRCSDAPTTTNSSTDQGAGEDVNSTITASSSSSSYPSIVRRVTHPQTRYGLATRPPFRALNHANYPALCSLFETLTPQSPLAFLKDARDASVLRGGYTNALYLVRVPVTTAVKEEGKEANNNNGGAPNSSTTGPVAAASPLLPPQPYATWVVRKSAASASEDPLFGVHRICRDAEHVAVAAAAAKGIAPTALFDPGASLLAQVRCLCD